MESKLDRDEHNNVRWTIAITGPTDIFRFGVNMLGWQVEFGDEASKVLTEIRRRMGARKHDDWARSMLGSDQFKRLKRYFMRKRREDS